MKREIVIDENRSFEGVWVPKKLYTTNKFNPRTKFFLVELKSLSKCGYCYASDKHFANFLGVSERMVQTIIKGLKSDEYLKTEYEYDEDKKSIKRRFLILTDKFYKEFYNESQENGIEKNCDTPIEKKFDTGTEKNCGEKYNNKNKYNSKSSITSNALFFDKNKGRVHACFGAKQGGTTSYSDKQLKERLISTVSNNAYDVESANVIFDIFMYFYKEYESRFSRKHPILSDKTYEKIITAYYEPAGDEISNTDVDIDDYKHMIDLYFDTEYNKRGNYDVEIDKSLQHFFSGQIRNHLLMRVRDCEDYV